MRFPAFFARGTGARRGGSPPRSPPSSAPPRFPHSGGPLRAGPRTLYPVHGFWLWTDANVFVASQLALDPDANVQGLVKRWARSRFGDGRIADAMPGVLDLTRKAVLQGFYIRPYA